MSKADAIDVAMHNLADGGLVDHDYHVRCLNCRYGRKLGNAGLSADTFATTHAIRKPGHVVEIRDYGVPVKRVENKRAALDDECPF